MFGRHDRGHIFLAVAVVIAGIAMGAILAFFLFKKSVYLSPIPVTVTSFANPLLFSNDQSQSDVADSNKLLENAAEPDNCNI